MSELKVYRDQEDYIAYDDYVLEEAYDKYEADKYIGDLKKERDWLAKDRAQAYDDLEKRAQLNIKLEESIRHQKYKRCLAMAEWCKAMCGHYLSYEEPEWFWFRKWSERWIKIAEKFKPNNEVNNG